MNRNFKQLSRILIGSGFGLIVLAGTAFTVNGQSVTEEYREWQRAQARAQQERRDYMRTRSRWDYEQWQAAERRARQEYREYQRTASGNSYGNYGYNNRNNNGYYNGSYNNNNNNRQFRIFRNGSYYSTDYRGAELLRQAVRNGYAQGYRQGRMDRRYNRGYNYGSISMYRTGTYGYQSYIDRSQYQYYFQQGFEKGYDDGYYSRNQYGSVSGNSFNILGTVLNSILNIAND
jgi:hypothetical protein